MENNENIIEVEYSRAKNYKRWFAFFIDIFIAFILGLFLSASVGAVTNVVPAYKNVVAERDEIENSTSIYSNGKAIILVMDASKDPVTDKKTTLNNAIEEFYEDKRFFTDDSYYNAYQDRKKNEKASDGESLFRFDESKGTYVESDYSDEDYYKFYYSEIEHYLIAYMSLNTRYTELTNIIVRISVVELIICMSIGYSISFLIVPLILKRGRRTIGMYMFKISLISVDALNVTGWTLFARDMLLLFVGFWLSVFTCFIPWAVSVTMMHFSKRGQDFFDYVSNTYVIDSSKRDVYLNYSEYLSRTGSVKDASMENNNFKISS